jgi:hypothetical protein
MRPVPLATAVLLALATGRASAQETVDNPEFASWSKFKPGTSITVKSTTVAAGMTSEATMTITLVEVGTDKVVLETSGVTKAMGMEFKLPASKRESPKTITLPKDVKKPPAPGAKPEGTYEDGTETVKAAGTEFKTKWYKTKTEADGVTTEGKIWISDDVPTTVVKMESKSSGAATAETKFELLEFKKP